METKVENAFVTEDLDLQIEELENIVAPQVRWNHNETVSVDEEIGLEVEEPEGIVAPGASFNHNEAMVEEL
jgi:hypothetical protein